MTMSAPMRSHSNKSSLLPNLSLTPYALLPFLLCNTGGLDVERGELEIASSETTALQEIPEAQADASVDEEAYHFVVLIKLHNSKS